MYVKARFEVSPFNNSRYCSNNTNMLSRIINTFTQAVNTRGKLPAYIVVVLDDDIISRLDYIGFGISSMMGEWLRYLIKNINEICLERKKQLPLKAIKEHYPVIYWSTAPHHMHLTNNPIRSKFNNCLESILKLYKNMHPLKMKEVWDYNNAHLVIRGTGAITSYGLNKYWSSIDAVVQYNVVCHEQFVHKEERNKFHEGMEKSKRFQQANTAAVADAQVKKIFAKRKRHDKFHWKREDTQTSPHFKLPKLS